MTTDSSAESKAGRNDEPIENGELTDSETDLQTPEEGLAEKVKDDRNNISNALEGENVLIFDEKELEKKFKESRGEERRKLRAIWEKWNSRNKLVIEHVTDELEEATANNDIEQIIKLIEIAIKIGSLGYQSSIYEGLEKLFKMNRYEDILDIYKSPSANDDWIAGYPEFIGSTLVELGEFKEAANLWDKYGFGSDDFDMMGEENYYKALTKYMTALISLEREDDAWKICTDWNLEAKSYKCLANAFLKLNQRDKAEIAFEKHKELKSKTKKNE